MTSPTDQIARDVRVWYASDRIRDTVKKEKSDGLMMKWTAQKHPDLQILTASGKKQAESYW